MKRILVIGQCTLHWGRMEFGNIGNYYIVEPLFRELHRVFPHAEIVTTMQMTKEFQERENIQVLPMDMYYAWHDNDLEIAQKEYEIAKKYNQTGILEDTTPYIEEVMKSDLVIDFSGEMWSSVHAELVGHKRFEVGLYKDRTAQLLKRKTAMIATGQGPFSKETFEFAKETLEAFDMVLTREDKSIKLLKDMGVSTKNIIAAVCPSFLFEGSNNKQVKDILIKEKIIYNGEKSIGFILCGFNMLTGPYDIKKRPDNDFTIFAEAVEYIVNKLNKNVVLLSHQNGFELPPNFKPINGRDFYISQQLYNVLEKRGVIDMKRIHLITTPYNPWQTKAIIRNLDMLVTGRLHASVGGVTEYVPTVVIMHGHGPISHKTIGFHEIVGTEQYIADPKISNNIIEKIELCYNNKHTYKEYLTQKIPMVKQYVRDSFDKLKDIFDAQHK